MTKTDLINFLNNQEEVLKIPMMPIQDIVDWLDEEGYEQAESDTNGWQVDFWYSYSKNEKVIEIAGSLWYGGFTLSKQTK